MILIMRIQINGEEKKSSNFFYKKIVYAPYTLWLYVNSRYSVYPHRRNKSSGDPNSQNNKNSLTLSTFSALELCFFLQMSTLKILKSQTGIIREKKIIEMKTLIPFLELFPGAMTWSPSGVAPVL